MGVIENDRLSLMPLLPAATLAQLGHQYARTFTKVTAPPSPEMRFASALYAAVVEDRVSLASKGTPAE
jgi:hypothetical protein